MIKKLFLGFILFFNFNANVFAHLGYYKVLKKGDIIITFLGHMICNKEECQEKNDQIEVEFDNFIQMMQLIYRKHKKVVCFYEGRPPHVTYNNNVFITALSWTEPFSKKIEQSELPKCLIINSERRYPMLTFCENYIYTFEHLTTLNPNLLNIRYNNELAKLYHFVAPMFQEALSDCDRIVDFYENCLEGKKTQIESMLLEARKVRNGIKAFENFIKAEDHTLLDLYNKEEVQNSIFSTPLHNAYLVDYMKIYLLYRIMNRMLCTDDKNIFVLYSCFATDLVSEILIKELNFEQVECDIYPCIQEGLKGCREEYRKKRELLYKTGILEELLEIEFKENAGWFSGCSIQ